MNTDFRNNIIELSNTLTRTNQLKAKTKVDKEIKKLSEEAYNYLKQQAWCKEVEEGWLAEGWGYILGIFLFRINPSSKNVDDYVWIVVGDIPPAYIDIESAQTIEEVLKSYILIMRDWTHAVLNKLSLTESFPVAVDPSEKMANMLNRRLDLLESEILPLFDQA